MFMAVILLSAHNLFTIPASRDLITFIQPDGTEVVGYVHGDERLSWHSTEDGYTMMFNSSGYLEYAMHNKDRDLVPSGIIAKNIDAREILDINFLKSIKKDLRYSRKQIDIALEATKQMETRMGKVVRKEGINSGIRKLLVILIDYPAGTYNGTHYDAVPFQYSRQEFENVFNQLNYNWGGATGSVRDYFRAASNNILDLQSTIVGPYTLPNPRPFYGARSGNANDINSKQMIIDALNLANDEVDYSQYDNDGDLLVDGVHVVFAGRGEHNSNESDAIWPHRSRLSPPVILDGVQIVDYSCSSEKRSFNEMSGIGVHSHEFGHVLGLMDYYDTDYQQNGISKTMGEFDIMDAGAYNNSEKTPPLWNAFSLMELGWADVYEIDPDMLVDIVSLPASDTNIIYKINTTTPGEYFLLQNRYRYKWDNYFFKDAGSLNGGLMLLHIDENCQGFIEHNCFNCYAGHNAVRLVSADNNFVGYETSIQWQYTSTSNLLFPGSSNITSLGDNNTSSANLKSWAGQNTGVEITDITFNQGEISFKVNGGAKYGVTVHTSPATNITHTSATLNGSIEASVSGDANIIEAGVVIDTIPFPKHNDATKHEISTTGEFEYPISDLLPGKEYYYRTYGINTNGIAYGEDIKFLTNSDAITNNIIVDSNFAACSTGEMPTIIGSEPIGGSGLFKYKWLESLDGIEFNETKSPGNKKNFTPSNMTEPTYYKRIAISADKADTSAHKLVGIVDSTIAGNIVAVNTEITVGQTTGEITLSGHEGNIEFWQRKIGSDLWTTVSGSEMTNPFSETPDEEGDFQYRVRVRNGACPFKYSNTVAIKVKGVGLDDINSGESIFAIYPNPSDGNFTLELSPEAGKSLELTVLSISGQIIYTKKNLDKTNKIELPITKAGNYILTIKDGEKVVGSRQIIISE